MLLKICASDISTFHGVLKEMMNYHLIHIEEFLFKSELGYFIKQMILTHLFFNSEFSVWLGFGLVLTPPFPQVFIKYPLSAQANGE